MIPLLLLALFFSPILSNNCVDVEEYFRVPEEEDEPQNSQIQCEITEKNGNCEPGWKNFTRPSGEWCIKVFFEDQMFYDDAQKRCGEHGAVLTGLQNYLEAHYITYTAMEHFMPAMVSVLIGLKRIPACENVGRTKNCTYKNSFAWTDNSATGTDGLLWSAQQPDNAYSRKQHCAVLMASPVGYIGGSWKYQSGTMDDVVCEKKYFTKNINAFACGKKPN